MPFVNPRTGVYHEHTGCAPDDFEYVDPDDDEAIREMLEEHEPCGLCATVEWRHHIDG